MRKVNGRRDSVIFIIVKMWTNSREFVRQKISCRMVRSKRERLKIRARETIENVVNRDGFVW